MKRINKVPSGVSQKVYMVNKYKIALNRGDEKMPVEANGLTTIARGYLA